MIYTSKKHLADSLGITINTVANMEKRQEVKRIYNQRNKKVGYVKVIDFIKYLVE